MLFLIAAVASFVGSLQAGLVNTAVLAHTIQRGPEAGRRMAVGGSLPELLYAGVACLRIRFAAAKLVGLSDEDRHFYTTMSTAFIASILAFIVGGAFLAAAFNDLTWLVFGAIAALHRLFKADERALRPTVVADRAAPVIPRPRRQAIA